MSLQNLTIDKSWTLFLDRDGVINKRLVGDYVKSLDEFQILDGVPQAIASFCQLFNKVVVVTNQQGIGKGLMTEGDLQTVHNFLQEKVNQKGGNIDQFYFAPQLAAENSPMRKPGIGMALAAQKDFPSIDLKKSIMVGDSISDMQFGKNAGMITIFISEEKEYDKELCDYSFPSLKELAQSLNQIS